MIDTRGVEDDSYEVAVVPENARRLLKRFDTRSRHYEVMAEMRGKGKVKRVPADYGLKLTDAHRKT